MTGKNECNTFMRVCVGNHKECPYAGTHESISTRIGHILVSLGSVGGVRPPCFPCYSYICFLYARHSFLKFRNQIFFQFLNFGSLLLTIVIIHSQFCIKSMLHFLMPFQLKKCNFYNKLLSLVHKMLQLFFTSI